MNTITCRTYTFTTPGGFFGIDRIRQYVDLVTVRVNYRWVAPPSRSTDSWKSIRKMPAQWLAFLWDIMVNHRKTPSTSERRREMAHQINEAFEKSNVAAACKAIGDATRLYNISDIAERSGYSVQASIVHSRVSNLQTFQRS